jgi:hypothetical protein
MIVSIVLVLGGWCLGVLTVCLLSPASEYIDHDADNFLCYEMGYKRGAASTNARWLRQGASMQADFKGMAIAGNDDNRDDSYEATHLLRINRIA